MLVARCTLYAPHVWEVAILLIKTSLPLETTLRRKHRVSRLQPVMAYVESTGQAAYRKDAAAGVRTSSLASASTGAGAPLSFEDFSGGVPYEDYMFAPANFEPAL